MRSGKKPRGKYNSQNVKTEIGSEDINEININITPIEEDPSISQSKRRKMNSGSRMLGSSNRTLDGNLIRMDETIELDRRHTLLYSEPTIEFESDDKAWFSINRKYFRFESKKIILENVTIFLQNHSKY